MENNDNKSKDLKVKIAGFLREKGVYIVLFACLAVVGVAAALMFMPGGQNPEPTPDNSSASKSGDESLDAVRTIPPVATPGPEEIMSPSPVPDFTPSTTPSTTPKVTKTKLQPPVSGNVIWDFAMNELIYSETLNHWTTHSGVDIAAQLGAEVKAVQNGTVKRVYEDDALGVSVEIEHADGVRTIYSNLKEDPPVKEGDKVNKGHIIGYVGDTASSECGTQSHLHFEYLVDGAGRDPREYVLFAE